MLEIVDPTVVAMDGHVDEIDVLFLQPGAAALVTMDALGGQSVQGIVDEVGTRPASQQFSARRNGPGDLPGQHPAVVAGGPVAA